MLAKALKIFLVPQYYPSMPLRVSQVFSKPVESLYKGLEGLWVNNEGQHEDWFGV